MAAGFEQAAEFRFCEVERTEPRSTRLRVWHRRQSIERRFAASLGAAEFVSIAALSLDGKSVRSWNCKPIGVDNTALIGGLGTESDRTVGEPADAERKHTPVISKCEHAPIKSERELTPIVGGKWREPFGRLTKLQPTEFIGLIEPKRIQRWRRRRGLNACGEFAGISESRRRRRQRWWWTSLSYNQVQ